MATNNFKAFGIGAGANVTSQSDYEALAALLTGFQSGKASSAQINKALRQSTTMANVLAQFISDSASVDVLDNGTPATILANLKSAMTSITPGRLLNIQVITASGTYTPTAGAKKAIVEMVGGGGASGGTPASSSTVNFASGGGGGGAYAKFLVSNPTATPISIGAAGVVSGGTGGAGGVTSFGSIASVSGGGGSSYSQASGAALIANGGSGGQTITLSSDCVPITRIYGESGDAAVMINSGSGGGNGGGSSVMGTGGSPNGNGNGNAGTGYGSGAGGAMRGTNNTGATASGANGTAGAVIVWEYA